MKKNEENEKNDENEEKNPYQCIKIIRNHYRIFKLASLTKVESLNI